MPLNFRNQRVTVMGLGQFGGGVGVARFLVARGARVLVTDQKSADELKASVAQLDGLPITFRLGEHRIEDFTDTDLVVVNPAVNPRGNSFIEAALAAGVPLTSEIRLLIQHLPNRLRTIGVTGSAGKSTTTAMIGHALGRALGDDHVHIGGNLGGSLLGKIDRIGRDDWVVLELSSFMLEGIRQDRWSPHIAVITNLSPNHLDWHGTLDAYRDAKAVITAFQNDAEGDAAILGPGAESHFTPAVRQVLHVTHDQTTTIPDLLIPGEHNRLNAAMALAACGLARISQTQAVQSLTDFPGLQHRLQFVCEHAGVRFFNDSKATTPEAAILAMRSFPAGILHIILGGYDKKSDLTEMARAAAQHCRAIYTIGKTGPAIAQAARGLASASATIHSCTTLDAALHAIVGNLHQGDVVLLSPGCASWDQFPHFEVRGNAFVEAVLKYTGEGSPAPKQR